MLQPVNVFTLEVYFEVSFGPTFNFMLRRCHLYVLVMFRQRNQLVRVGKRPYFVKKTCLGFLKESSGFMLRNVETQSWTGVTGLVAISPVAPPPSSPPFDMKVCDLPINVATSTRYVDYDTYNISVVCRNVNCLWWREGISSLKFERGRVPQFPAVPPSWFMSEQTRHPAKWRQCGRNKTVIQWLWEHRGDKCRLRAAPWEQTTHFTSILCSCRPAS